MVLLELYTFLLIVSLFSGSLSSQVILRSSDGSHVDKIKVLSSSDSFTVDKHQLSKIRSVTNGKVNLDGKKYDYILSRDSLVFLDNVTEIQDVLLVKRAKISREIAYRSSIKNQVSASLSAQNYLATLIQPTVAIGKISYLKEVVLYPYTFMNKIENPIEADEVKVILAPNKDGQPDFDNPYLIFQQNFFNNRDKKWIFKLPQIIRYPKEGLFFILFHESSSAARLYLKLNDESDILFYYPEEKKWKSGSFNGFKYSVEVLQ